SIPAKAKKVFVQLTNPQNPPNEKIKKYFFLPQQKLQSTFQDIRNKDYIEEIPPNQEKAIDQRCNSNLVFVEKKNSPFFRVTIDGRAINLRTVSPDDTSLPTLDEIFHQLKGF